MQLEQAKTTIKSVKEIGNCRSETANEIKNMAQQVATTKKLWKEGNKSKLIKLGMALVVFPEPTPVSETVGSCFIAAGLIQKGIQSRSIFLEDINKTFKSTLKEICASKHNLNL